jgi:hypothetical protein
MRRTLLTAASGAILIVAGCATHSCERVPTNYFLFNEDAKSGLWRSRYDDFIEIAKAYAKEKRIPFNFEGTSANLWVVQENGALIARVDFRNRFGSTYLDVDIDTAGRAIRHYIGVSSE